MRAPVGSVRSRRAVESLPDVDGLWRLANGTSLGEDERRRLDGAIAWALGSHRGRVADTAVIRFLGALAFSDGELHERELRLLLRTLLHGGVASAAELSLVRADLSSVIAEVDVRGGAVVAEEAARALGTDERRRMALRLASLCVVSDHALEADELEGWRAIASALGATAVERRDTLAAAAALYARG